MNSKAVIIFIKNPEKGKVKTRLAKTIGDDRALAVYQKLLAHTRDVMSKVDAEKYLYYSNEVNAQDDWSNEQFIKRVQAGNDLGQRMSNAFREVFERGHTEVVIIGSDCYQLNNEIINSALNGLREKNVVIGPTYDGGYYLLGMSKYIEDVFLDKQWSTATVYSDTINDIGRLKLSYVTLPKLSDIDEEKDLPDVWR